jgi:hypothetical protein
MDNNTNPPKYKLVTKMSPNGVWDIEYPPTVNQIPLQIYADMLNKYIKQGALQSIPLLHKITNEFVGFISTRVEGLRYKVDDIECIATISWDSVKRTL